MIAYCNRDDSCIEILFRVSLFIALILSIVLCVINPEIIECITNLNKCLYNNYRSLGWNEESLRYDYRMGK